MRPDDMISLPESPVDGDDLYAGIFWRRVESSVEQLRALREETSGSAEPVRAVVETAMSELAGALEELRVSHEEIRAQNDELAMAYAELAAERKRYANLFDRAPDAYIVTDSSGVITEANASAEQLLGLARAGLRGKPLALFVPGATQHLAHVVQASDAEHSLELTARPYRGEPVPVEVRLSLADAPYSANAVAWILRDISDHRRSEAASRRLLREEAVREASQKAEQRARFVADVSRLLAESMDYDVTLATVARHSVPFLADVCVIDIIDEDKSLRVAAAHADPALAPLVEQLKLTPADPRLGEMQHIEIVPDARAPAEFARAESENRMLWEMGVRSLLSVPLIADGAVLGAMTLGAARDLRDVRALSEDVAHRVALAVQQSRLFQQAQAASQSKSHFISVISHEFRTPLTSIIGFTEILMLGQLQDRQREQLTRVQSSAWHLVGLIDEILTFARTEAGRETVTIESQDIADLVRRTVAIIEPLAQPKGVRVDVIIDDADWSLGIDGGKLRQILFNLLTNAIKFTEQGVVSVQLARTDEQVTCTVRDSGIGIAPEHLEKIFEPFWQVDQSNTRPYGGTGLGLSVTRRLARLMGGDISVSSRAGSGSAFALRLPVRSPGDS